MGKVVIKNCRGKGEHSNKIKRGDHGKGQHGKGGKWEEVATEKMVMIQN
jgi:hypothetical protein